MSARGEAERSRQGLVLSRREHARVRVAQILCEAPVRLKVQEPLRLRASLLQDYTTRVKPWPPAARLRLIGGKIAAATRLSFRSGLWGAVMLCFQ